MSHEKSGKGIFTTAVAATERERLCGKRRLRHASASDIVSLIYQFGSNVNNRAITNAIAARMTEGAGLSLSFRRRGPLTTWDARESLVTAARRAIVARGESILARSSRPSRCIAFRTIVNKFRIWDTHPSRHFYSVSAAAIKPSFPFFFSLRTTEWLIPSLNKIYCLCSSLSPLSFPALFLAVILFPPHFFLDTFETRYMGNGVRTTHIVVMICVRKLIEHKRTLELLFYLNMRPLF